jgi:hypothetical protein
MISKPPPPRRELGIIKNPFTGTFLDKQRYSHDDNKQTPGHHGAIPHFAVFKGVGKQMHGNGVGGIQRPPIGKNVGLLEYLECPDG